MLPGPNIVYKCPNCVKYIFNPSLESGNTFGAQFYSDGYCIAPMLPDLPDLSKCHSCNTLFWLSKLKECGTFEPGTKPQGVWRLAKQAEHLSLDEYLKALQDKMYDDFYEEQEIRRRILWAFNDRVRAGKPLYEDEKEATLWEENISGILKILQADDSAQQILRAEILRYQGKFEDCMQIIEALDKEHYQWWQASFRKACNQKSTKVFLLSGE